MRHRMPAHLIAMLLATLFALIGLTTAVAAEHVIHYTLAFYEESVGPIDDAESCIGYTGTIIERRDLVAHVTEHIAGPRQGEIHLVGVVDATFTIAPDPGIDGPVYEGSYREKIVLQGSSLDEPDVVSFILPASATGSDGSKLKFLLHGHAVMGADGEVKLEFQKFSCIQPGA
jgi:hypothetical protein